MRIKRLSPSMNWRSLSVRIESWVKAEQYSQRALAAARRDEDHTLTLQALFALGLIASQKGQSE